MDFIINLLKKLFSLLFKPRTNVIQETLATPIQEPPKSDVETELTGKGTDEDNKPTSAAILSSINNSRGYSYYTQRNNNVAANQACNVTAMTMGLLYNKCIYKKDECWYNYKGEDIYALNKDSLPVIPFTQFEDNLIHFIRNDSRVLDYYNRSYPNLYYDWVKERDEVEKKGEDLNLHAFKAYPPNELHLVLSYGTNLFINCNVTSYETRGIDTIIKLLKSGASLVVSGQFQGLNHVVCVVGIQYEKDTGKVHKFLIDDPWYKTLDYKSKKTGDDSLITYDDFLKYVKPLNNKEKACHIFTVR